MRHRPFSWSFSRLKNFEVCPRRYYEVDITKRWAEEESAQLKYGNEVHEAIAAHISNGTPLLPEHRDLARVIDPVLALRGSGVKVLVEQQLAINRKFEPVGYFDKGENGAWFRVKVDLCAIDPERRKGVALDWKTGKKKEDMPQLALTALVVFAHFPVVDSLACQFVWLQDNDTTTSHYKREDAQHIWAALLPRYQRLEDAHNRQDYPPAPGRFCAKWCPVRDCEHHGRKY
jgi:RecB family exonuclease